MPLGIPKGAMCVQRFDDSLNSAIHITYRISLRSSSMPEPRDPLLKVFFVTFLYSDGMVQQVVERAFDERGPEASGRPPKQRGYVITGGRLAPRGHSR